MPSFYPRSAPNGLPLTPPEFVPNYNAACAGMQYSQGQMTCQSGMARDYLDRYDQTASLPAAPQSMVYQHPNSTFGSGTAASGRTYYDSNRAPLLPPPRVSDQYNAYASHSTRHQEQHSRAEQPQRKEEKPVGGVSAKLDYDMDMMTDFVAKLAGGIVDPAFKSDHPSFRRWVHSVLTATRLPSATILLGLQYLTNRLHQLKDNNQFQVNGGEHYIMPLLTVSLVLGSKFLDDNTFINRSWQEVSGIDLAKLNYMELEWLVAIDFKLHRDPHEAQGWYTWKSHWEEFERNAVAQSALAQSTARITLAPLDTTGKYQRSLQSYSSPVFSPSHSTFKSAIQEFVPTPASSQFRADSVFTPYDNFLTSRSANDYSPPSAPYTGPTTPEYYGSHPTWGSEVYNRRSMFGLVPALSQGQILPQPQTQSQAGPATYNTYPPSYPCGAWNGHGAHCNCMHCLRQHSYFNHSLQVVG
jgi:hypothetical protein